MLVDMEYEEHTKSLGHHCIGSTCLSSPVLAQARSIHRYNMKPHSMTC